MSKNWGKGLITWEDSWISAHYLFQEVSKAWNPSTPNLE